jgi:glycosyltransferase involved in cell wall biosynthesis
MSSLSTLSVSAIIACYKDAQAIPIMADRLRATFAKIGIDYEIIFVNDGSPDDTQEVLERLTASDPCIKAITHSRNFGSQSAFTSGMRLASGGGCVLLDGDLLDPPDLIEQFHAKWLEGYDVVYGVRVRREMPWAWELAYKSFYRIFHRVANIRIPVDAGDFSLIDRKVVSVLNQLPERDRFVRGLRAWVGFKQTGVPYVRPERMFGRSTNNLISNLRWARKGIFAFSYVPLELISLGALLISLLAILAIVGQVIARLVRPDIPQGISTIIVLCLFLGATNLLSLSFIAEYVGKMFEEVKQRPLYVVSKLLNFDANERAQPSPTASGVNWVAVTALPSDAHATGADDKLASSAAE